MGTKRARGVGIALAVLGIAPSAALGVTAPPGAATAAAKLVRKTVRPNGAIYLTVAVSVPGQLLAVGVYGPGAKRAGASSVTLRPLPKPFGSALANPTAAGTVTLKLKPSRKARAALRRRHRLLVYLTVSLLPQHGSAVTLRTHTTVRLKPLRKR